MGHRGWGGREGDQGQTSFRGEAVVRRRALMARPSHYHPGLPQAVGSHDLHARPPLRALPGRGLHLPLLQQDMAAAEMEAQASMMIEAMAAKARME